MMEIHKDTFSESTLMEIHKDAFSESTLMEIHKDAFSESTVMEIHKDAFSESTVTEIHKDTSESTVMPGDPQGCLLRINSDGEPLIFIKLIDQQRFDRCQIRDHHNPTFLQGFWLMMMYHQTQLAPEYYQQFRRYSRNSHVFII